MASAPMSPHRPVDEISDEATELLVQQFLDDWHFRIIHSSLGRSWDREQVIDAALQIFQINGVRIDDDERPALLELEEAAMVEWLTSRIGQPLRRKFETLALQLQVVVSMTTGIRGGLDNHAYQEVQHCLDQTDGAGIGQQIMKQTIIAAARDIGNVKSLRQSWNENTAKRLERLLYSATIAERAQKELIAIEAQLNCFGDEQNAKNKKIMMSMSSGRDDQLLHNTFMAWFGMHLKFKQEKGIRDKYEKRAQDAENAIIQWQEKRILNIRNALMRTAASSDKALMDLCVETWWEAVDEAKREGGTKAEMERLEAQLKASREGAREGTMSVMNKMAAESDDTLIALVFAHFVKFSEQYKKDKELEDQVKQTEKALAEHMAKKKDEAKGVLDRMAGASGQGLLMQCVQGWAKLIKDDKEERELAERMNGNADRFKSLQDRQSGSAMGMQTRVNDQMKTNLLMRVVGMWVIEAKVCRIDKYYQHKIDSKRKQLASCQSLFKSFAKQLEQGLEQVTQGDEDSPGRTSNSTSRSQRRSQRGEAAMARASPHAASLPDIHARAVVA